MKLENRNHTSPLHHIQPQSYYSHPQYHRTIRHLPLLNYNTQQQSLTQRLLHLWILFTFLTIAGSESGEGSSSSSSQLSTDEVLGTAEARGPLACKFPSHWVGNWFQSGVHHAITITSSTISTKGKCLQVDGEKYLVYQPHSNCYRCLVFSEKHINVLQYKETYCIPDPDKRSLPSICSKISGDAMLYAMFRLEANPIECPLQGPFTFSYDRGHGECRYPESSLSSCTQSSRLLFNYEACPDVPKTESVEEELQCLAAWKEGSYRYFLGLIQYRHHASSSYEERFRCYAYEMISSNGNGGGGGSSNLGNIRRGEMLNSHNLHQHQYPQTLALGRSRPKPYQGVTMMNNFNNTTGSGPHSLMSSTAEILYRVEQSGDATCNGLSTMEGSRTMFLRKVQQPETKNCQFPSWVQTHPQWRSLDQSTIYEFDGDQFRVTNYSAEQIITANGPDSLAKSGSCMKVLEDEPGHRAIIILHARASCNIGYQCLVIHKRDSDILEIQFGEWSRKHEEACSRFYFDPYRQPFITLITSTPKSAQCPAIGQFSLKLPLDQQFRFRSSIQAFVSGGFLEDQCITNGTLRMGCSSLDSLQLEISSECHDPNHHHNHEEQQSHNIPSFREVTDYNCHGWWEEDGITYMIATLFSSSTKLRAKRHCFVIRDSSSSIQSSPQWMHLKQSQEGQMSLFRHSNGDSFDAAGQREGSVGNSPQRQMFDTHSETTSSSAALFSFNNNNNNNIRVAAVAAGKILEISSFADSCRRNVVVGVQGDFAFNATKTGHCFASSSSPSVMIRGGSVNGRGAYMVMVMVDEMMTTTLPLTWILPVAVILVSAVRA